MADFRRWSHRINDIWRLLGYLQISNCTRRPNCLTLPADRAQNHSTTRARRPDRWKRGTPAMQRNPYKTLHKTIRARLSEVGSRAGSIDFADQEARVAYQEDFTRLASLLEHHGQHEDAHIHPLLAEYGESEVRAMDDQHEALEREFKPRQSARAHSRCNRGRPMDSCARFLSAVRAFRSQLSTPPPRRRDDRAAPPAQMCKRGGTRRTRAGRLRRRSARAASTDARPHAAILEHCRHRAYALGDRTCRPKRHEPALSRGLPSRTPGRLLAKRRSRALTLTSLGSRKHSRSRLRSIETADRESLEPPVASRAF